MNQINDSNFLNLKHTCTCSFLQPTDLLKKIYEQFIMESKQGTVKNIKNIEKTLNSNR